MSGKMFEISADMIEAVFREYEADNPGRIAANMPEEEFTARMMRKIAASVRPISEAGHA